MNEYVFFFATICTSIMSDIALYYTCIFISTHERITLLLATDLFTFSFSLMSQWHEPTIIGSILMMIIAQYYSFFFCHIFIDNIWFSPLSIERLIIKEDSQLDHTYIYGFLLSLRRSQSWMDVCVILLTIQERINRLRRMLIIPY